MTKSKHKNVVAYLCLGIVSVNTLAHNTVEAQENEDETLVWGRHAGKQLEGITSVYSYFDIGELEQQGQFDLNSALKSRAGVGISNSGQTGGIYAVRLRGLRAEDTQLRIDGVRVNDRGFNLQSVLGSSNFAGFSSLEVYKGGQAAVFGSHANAGVLALSTGSGKGRQGAALSTEIGSFNTGRARLEWYGEAEKFNYYLYTDLFSTDNDTYKGNSESATNDNDYVNKTYGLRLGYDVSDSVQLGATLRRVDSSFDSVSGTLSESDLTFATLFAQAELNENWQSKWVLSYFKDETDFTSGFGVFATEYEQYGFAWENTYSLSDNAALSFGYEYEKSDFNSQTLQALDEDYYNAAYLNFANTHGALSYSLGARYEDYDRAGSELSWQGGFRYNVEATKTTLRGQVGTGFVTPTINELFGPGFNGFAVGNKNLEAETTFGWDVGLEQKINEDTVLSINFFETDISNAITAGPSYFNDKANKQKASGIEATLEGKLHPSVSYELHYTWLDRSRDGQPEQSARSQISYAATDAWTVGAGWEYLDQRSYGGDKLKHAFIARAFTSYQWSDNLQLTARIENLTDKRYNYNEFSAFGSPASPAPRLAAYLGAKVSW